MRTAGIIAVTALVTMTGCKRNVVVKSTLAPDTAASTDVGCVKAEREGAVTCDTN